jgi:cytochrome c oxidase subunit 2
MSRRTVARRAAAAGVLACSLAALSACDGIQSSLAPAGQDAERIARLFWWMTIGSVIVWAAVLALTFYCLRVGGSAGAGRLRHALIFGGGVVVPTVVLTVLLVYGLAMLPAAVARAPEGSLRIHVRGELWWWRVRYLPEGSSAVDLANEIRLPVGEPVQFVLDSDNVIHSFWIPSLAGKMDMIPGRVTYLTVRPTATGVFRGSCAEYCGLSHALMGLYVEVMPRAAFDRWLADQAAGAAPAAHPLAARGSDAFFATGCQACHTVRGTPASGAIGPDLTHVGSRLSLAAGILPNDADGFQRWIASTEHIKPGVHMPRFGMLPGEDLRAIAAYLESLK